MNDETQIFIETVRSLRPSLEGFTFRKPPSVTTVDWGDVAPVTQEEYDAAEPAVRHDFFMRELRLRRDARLAESDWTQLPDTSVADPQAWADYRQALRDLPANTVDPENPAWPEPPA